jgi:hypothetical protein
MTGRAPSTQVGNNTALSTRACALVTCYSMVKIINQTRIGEQQNNHPQVPYLLFYIVTDHLTTE